MTPTVLILACGALATELVELRKRNAWAHVQVRCLPPELHNTPAEIPFEVRDALLRYTEEFDHIFVAYADCGTGGALDRVLDEFGVQRLPGAHCYEFFSGAGAFSELADAEPGTFYLTDFMVRHFDRMVIQTLGLDRYPELRDTYFGNYRRLVYLAQEESSELRALARDHAALLGLEYHEHFTGLGPLELVVRQQEASWPS